MGGLGAKVTDPTQLVIEKVSGHGEQVQPSREEQAVITGVREGGGNMEIDVHVSLSVKDS